MSDYNDELQMMPIRAGSRNGAVQRGSSNAPGEGQRYGGSPNSGRNPSGSRGSSGSGSRKRRRKKKKPVFYKILLLSFLAGLVVIAIVLLVLYKGLEGYEARAVAKRSVEASNSASRYLSKKLSAESSFSISAEEAAKTSREEEIRLSAERSEEEIARTVVTEEERAEVEKRAIDFTKSYALFSLNDDDYRGDVLAYVDRSTPLYQHLAYYNNDWEGSFSNPTYEGMKVSNVKKSASDENVYTCRVDCLFRFNAGGSHEFNLDFDYTFKRNGNGRLMLTDMQGIEGT